ncbi:hypothetical protein Tdes44962_MAKER07834 [Teratosphaeria destructans]|uniref:Uncharacterized protein n=1 Tax=Teratosphaeria destructans TaxID=418781 RepID=A0A9W7SY95_9PEZI|nr:hypothetical protein Tdes44962_MAKER07834 [Teratosphaeria destructans]
MPVVAPPGAPSAGTPSNTALMPPFTRGPIEDRRTDDRRIAEAVADAYRPLGLDSAVEDLKTQHVERPRAEYGATDTSHCVDELCWRALLANAVTVAKEVSLARDQ